MPLCNIVTLAFITGRLICSAARPQNMSSALDFRSMVFELSSVSRLGAGPKPGSEFLKANLISEALSRAWVVQVVVHGKVLWAVWFNCMQRRAIAGRHKDLPRISSKSIPEAMRLPWARRRAPVRRDQIARAVVSKESQEVQVPSSSPSMVYDISPRYTLTGLAFAQPVCDRDVVCDDVGDGDAYTNSRVYLSYQYCRASNYLQPLRGDCKPWHTSFRRSYYIPTARLLRYLAYWHLRYCWLSLSFPAIKAVVYPLGLHLLEHSLHISPVKFPIPCCTLP